MYTKGPENPQSTIAVRSKAFQYHRFGSGATITKVARTTRWKGALVMSTLSSSAGRRRYTALSAIRIHKEGTTASKRELRNKNTGATWISSPQMLKISGSLMIPNGAAITGPSRDITWKYPSRDSPSARIGPRAYALENHWAPSSA